MRKTIEEFKTKQTIVFRRHAYTILKRKKNKINNLMKNKKKITNKRNNEFKDWG